jgi:hypothetical protein
MLQLQQETHDIMDQLIILVSLGPSGHLNVHLEVCLNYH